jgi:hypothetical protein
LLRTFILVRTFTSPGPGLRAAHTPQIQSSTQDKKQARPRNLRIIKFQCLYWSNCRQCTPTMLTWSALTGTTSLADRLAQGSQPVVGGVQGSCEEQARFQQAERDRTTKIGHDVVKEGSQTRESVERRQVCAAVPQRKMGLHSRCIRSEVRGSTRPLWGQGRE